MKSHVFCTRNTTPSFLSAACRVSERMMSFTDKKLPRKSKVCCTRNSAMSFSSAVCRVSDIRKSDVFYSQQITQEKSSVLY